MEISTPIGLILGFAALVVSFVMEGGNPAGLIKPSAAIMVFGGTLAATLTAFPLKAVMALPKLIMMSIKPNKLDPQGIIALFVSLADKARREGLLSLEEEAQKVPDPFLRRGIMLVVDGVDAQVVREVLESETANMQERHKEGFEVLAQMGGFSPTMGIIGTVTGLVNVLGSLSSNPEGLGEKIAAAFIATLYGVGFANLVWLPVSNKLKVFSAHEVAVREMTIAGVLAVQAGENPRVVREKLETYLAPKERGTKEGAAATAGAGAATATARAQA
jgi:chemotaxis protein MotA